MSEKRTTCEVEKWNTWQIFTLLLVAIGIAGHSDAARSQSWAKPSELRNKKLIDAGIYTLHATPAIHSRSLAEHSDFTSTHPFDGIAVRALLESKWCIQQNLKPDPDDPARNQEPYLDYLAWSTRAVPESAIQSAITDLKRVDWGTLTDNFLWYQFRNGGGFPVNIARDSDWSAVKQNAVMAARVCREAELKGILFDTEQYGYAPLKEATPDLRRQRGRQWIEAVQTEYPAIRVMFTFAWCNDLMHTEFLAGLQDFLNGILDGIQPPARLINAYENTFYYGHVAGSRFTKDGIGGDRTKYEAARQSIKDWRGLSTAPDKYDQIVDVGMAAWLESDPWDLVPGWPSGHKHTVWSNLPLALAVSDEYVWCWSEHTGYLASLLHPEMLAKRGPGPNPFLASVTNQTFNTGHERVRSLREDFSVDPLKRGWYFDFDILEVGRKFNRPLTVPIFSHQAVPHVWSEADQAVQIQGIWMIGENGDVVANLNRQRQRYVHPLQPMKGENRFHADFDFLVETFGSDPENPIVLGLFNHDQPTDRQSLILQIRSNGSVTLALSGDHNKWESDPGQRLKTDQTYRATFSYDNQGRQLWAKVLDLADSSLICQLKGTIPKQVGKFQLDEIGAAIWNAKETTPTFAKSYKYYLRRVRFDMGNDDKER